MLVISLFSETSELIPPKQKNICITCIFAVRYSENELHLLLLISRI